MILVRSVLQAKLGKGGELAALMAEGMRRMVEESGTGNRWRVLTDLSGPFDTVVLEVEEESLAAWERRRAELFRLPSFQASFARAMELGQAGGRNELYTIEAQG